jgi:hypothetical protein
MGMAKSCGNCVNCEKYGELWTCENVAGSEGWPCDCTPPNDVACRNWSNNPADKDKAQDALRYFVDHFWDNAD